MMKAAAKPMVTDYRTASKSFYNKLENTTTSTAS